MGDLFISIAREEGFDIYRAGFTKISDNLLSSVYLSYQTLLKRMPIDLEACFREWGRLITQVLDWRILALLKGALTPSSVREKLITLYLRLHKLSVQGMVQTDT